MYGYKNLEVGEGDTRSWWFSIFSGTCGLSLASEREHTSQAALEHRLDQYPEEDSQPIRSPKPSNAQTVQGKH
jgi:hypothetical protein